MSQLPRRSEGQPIPVGRSAGAHARNIRAYDEGSQPRSVGSSSRGVVSRFFTGPWKLAFIIALPLAGLYILGYAIYDLTRGNTSEVILTLVFGWALALVAALILAIPLGFILMGLNVSWRLAIWWWRRLPFRVTRK